MARIRSIKPEFWTSEQVMECSPIARLLFVGMWNFADDKGRLPCAPKTLKAQIFPGDDFDGANILRLIAELSENGLVHRYTVDDKEYLQVTGWHHQKIDKPQKPKHPEPPEHSPIIPRKVSTDLNTEGIGKDRIRKTIVAHAPKDERFEELRKAYPRRKGGDPGPPAAKLFAAAVKSGTDPQIIIDGAKRFAVEESQNINTPYIPQLVKWLRDKRWLDHTGNGTAQPSFDIRSSLV